MRLLRFVFFMVRCQAQANAPGKGNQLQESLRFGMMVEDSAILDRESEPPEIECVPRYAEVFDYVRDDPARHVAGVPRKRNEALRAEGIRVMPVAAGIAKMLTTDFAEPAF
jgi:hypothetical protein